MILMHFHSSGKESEDGGDGGGGCRGEERRTSHEGAAETKPGQGGSVDLEG